MKKRFNTGHNANRKRGKRVRYAVVGLGHISQEAVLPAFANARKNSELSALISDDAQKLRALSRQYHVDLCGDYGDYESLIHSGEIQAVYIALPNHLHREYAVRAAKAGVHVLCEKPLALDEEECHAIIEACADHDVKLMTAYRLHFDRANLEAIQLVQSGKIGDPRIFNSLFTMQVKEGNIRLKKETGGGTLYDIGIYCINAARYLFRDEPTDVVVFSANSGERRFREVDEMTSAILRFPKERLAAFTTSFGAADTAAYEVVGTKGTVSVAQAYEYSENIELALTVNDQTERRHYRRRDQFGPELVYFSDCILHDREPEPSGIEGLVDVHVVRCLLQSADQQTVVKVRELRRKRRPTLRQEIYRPPPRKPRQVHVEAPTH